MPTDFSRRLFLGGSGALLAQGAFGKFPWKAAGDGGGRAAVSLIRGDDRRKNAHDALEAIDDQIRPQLRRKKCVIAIS